MPLLRFDLEAKYASVMDALERIERQSGRAVAKVEGDFRKLGASIGAALGASLSVGALAASFKASVDELAAMKDAAEETGSSVESISAALNTLREAGGGGLAEITDLSSRLGRAMQNVDKDTSKSADALERLGLNIDELRGMGRVDAILEIARAQAKYAEGGEKSALIDAALGRGAAALIPVLNDLAETTRSAATVTTEQADAADAASKQLALFQAQAIAFRNDIVAKILPGFNELLVKLRAFAEIGAAPGDLFSAVLGDPAKVEADLAQRRASLQKNLDLQTKLAKDLAATPDTPRNRGIRDGLKDQLNEVNAALQQEGLRINQLERLLERRRDLERKFGMDAASPARPTPNARGLGDDSARKAAEDAAKAYQDLDAVVRQSDIDDELKRQADAAKAFADVTKDLVAQFERFEAIEITSKTAALGTDLKFFERVAAIMGELPSKVRANAEALTTYFDNRFFDGLISEEDWQAAIDRVNGITRNAKDETEKLSAAARDLGSTWESAFEKAVIGGEDAGKVLQGFLQDISRIGLRELVSKPVAAYLFGGEGGGGALTSFLSSLGIGARASGGPVSAGMPYLVGEQGPELIVPKMPGTVVPNGALAGGSLQVHVPLMVSDSMSRADTYNLVERAKREVLQTVGMGFARGALAGV